MRKIVVLDLDGERGGCKQFRVRAISTAAAARTRHFRDHTLTRREDGSVKTAKSAVPDELVCGVFYRSCDANPPTIQIRRACGAMAVCGSGHPARPSLTNTGANLRVSHQGIKSSASKRVLVPQ